MKYDKSSRAENPMMDALKAIVLGACFGAVFCMIGLIACALVFMGAKSIPRLIAQCQDPRRPARLLLYDQRGVSTSLL